MNIDIVDGKKEDFLDIFLLIKQLWPNLKFNEKTQEKIYHDELSIGKKFLLAKIDNKVIGFVSLLIRFGFEFQGRVGLIDELVIDAKFRGKGVGSKLLESIEKYALQNGCKRIDLISAFHRERSHEFYLKNGFKKTAYYFEKDF